ncbi:MAG: DUF6573 family protein [Planctomycetia bacterium]|nr:DUF6573 family protein [Planctomycetia bacterium]
MDNEKYNGWTNRETWLVKLWIDNDRESHFFWRSVAVDLRASETGSDVNASLARCLETTLENDAPQLTQGMYADLLSAAMSRVDWFEIATSMLDDLDEDAPHAAANDFELIHSYSRAQAIADGVLVDASKLAAEAGFKYPVALTSAAWADCVAVPDGADDQDETGRLWDVLNVLRFAIKSSPQVRDSSALRFKVSICTGKDSSEDIELKSICGPGDDAAPVITIMLPGED